MLHLVESCVEVSKGTFNLVESWESRVEVLSTKNVFNHVESLACRSGMNGYTCVSMFHYRFFDDSRIFFLNSKRSGFCQCIFFDYSPKDVAWTYFWEGDLASRHGHR